MFNFKASPRVCYCIEVDEATIVQNRLETMALASSNGGAKVALPRILIKEKNVFS